MEIGVQLPAGDDNRGGVSFNAGVALASMNGKPSVIGRSRRPASERNLKFKPRCPVLVQRVYYPQGGRDMKRIASAVSAAFMVFAVIFTVFPAAVQARAVIPVEDARFDVAGTIKDNLKIYVGKDVVIHLNSGKSLEGYVKSIGDHLMHVEKLAGKDFYDALIRIEDITAIEARFRDMK